MAAMCLHCLVSVFTQSGIADFNSTHLELSTLMWWIQIVSMMLVVVTIFPLIFSIPASPLSSLLSIPLPHPCTAFSLSLSHIFLVSISPCLCLTSSLSLLLVFPFLDHSSCYNIGGPPTFFLINPCHSVFSNPPLLNGCDLTQEHTAVQKPLSCFSCFSFNNLVAIAVTHSIPKDSWDAAEARQVILMQRPTFF